MIVSSAPDWRQISLKGLEFGLELRATGMAEYQATWAEHEVERGGSNEGCVMKFTRARREQELTLVLGLVGSCACISWRGSERGGEEGRVRP